MKQRKYAYAITDFTAALELRPKKVENLMTQRFGKGIVRLSIFILLYLGSLGVYFGRFIRPLARIPRFFKAFHFYERPHHQIGNFKL